MREQLAESTDSKQRWRSVKNMLHSNSSDKTLSTDECAGLCTTFSNYFVNKINNLKLFWSTANLGSMRTPSMFFRFFFILVLYLQPSFFMYLFVSMLSPFSVKIYFSNAKTFFLKYFFLSGVRMDPKKLLNITFHISCSNDARAMIFFCFAGF